MIIRVYLDGSRSQWRDVTIDSETTCTGVIAECRGDATKGDRGASYYLAELCMGYERVVDFDERPLEILQQWGSHSDKVQFILRQADSSLSHPATGEDGVMTDSASEGSQSMAVPPDILLGTEFSIERLVQIVAMQREQLDAQQKMLTKKTHQLTSLQQQQQQQRRDEVVEEKNERLSVLRERIKEKEAKLKKLKSLKALVQEQGKTNNAFSNELEAMKNNFDKKEHELTAVIDKMELLTRKLKALHEERSLAKGPSSSDTSGSGGCSIRKEKLQSQIQECNLMNEQNSKLLQQKEEALMHQQKQIADFELRISEVQARLSTSHQKTKQAAAANRRLDVPLRDFGATRRQQSDSSTTGQSILTWTSKYKTLPHGLKFTDVEVMKKSVENQRLREEKEMAINGKTGKAVDFAGQSSQSKGTYAVSEKNGRGKSANAVDRRPASALGVQSKGVDGVIISSSKTGREDPSSLGYKISTNLLMNHFAPRPYASKQPTPYTSVLSPSDLISIDRSKSDCFTEILITDPPALTPAASVRPMGVVGATALPLASAAFSKTSDSEIHHLTTDDSQSTENKAVTVEARNTTTTQSTLLTTSNDRKRTVDDASNSRQQSGFSSAAAIVTSNLRPLGRTMALTDTSPSGQVANAGSRQTVRPKEVTERMKTSEPGFPAASSQPSSASWRKAASFDDTLSESRSTELPLQRVARSFHSPSSGVFHSPNTLEAVHTEPQKAKAESRTGASTSKVDARISSTTQAKPECREVVDSKNPASGGGGGASRETQVPSRFPWTSKSKDLKSKSLTNLVPSVSSSQRKVATPESSQLQSAKPSSSGLASALTGGQGASTEQLKKNSLDQNPNSDDEVDSSRGATDDLRGSAAASAKTSSSSSSQVSERSGANEGRSNASAEAGELGGSESKQSSIPPSSRTGQRYIPKSIAAGTHLQRLRADVVDQHSRSLDQLYGRFSSSALTTTDSDSVQVVEPSRPAAVGASPKTEVTGGRGTVQRGQSGSLGDFKVEEKTKVEVIANKDVELRGARAGVGPEVERQVHRPIIPRPVRRRMSSGDVSEDYPGKAHQRTENSNHNSGDDVSTPNALSGVSKRASDGHGAKQSRLNLSSVEPDERSEEKKNSFSRPPFRRQGNLKRTEKPKLLRRVSFEPLALLLDASLEGELDLVEKTAREVPDVSASNDEGITALHNAICAGHFDIVKFLVEFGCDVNSPDSDGWTPLHCAASCNNLLMVEFLVEHGACIFATTFSDQELASDKCEEDEEGYDTCLQYLRETQDRMGFVNDGIVYAVFDYEAENHDELSFRSGDRILVVRKGDANEQEWWWSQMADREGYVPRNLLGLFPRVVPQWLRNIQPAC